MQAGEVKGGSPNPSLGPPTATSPTHDGRAGAGGFASPERPSYLAEVWRGQVGSSVSPPTGAESDLLVDLSSNFLGGAVHAPLWLQGARSGCGEEFDPFPSLFMAAPFLNVHPKKQYRAECLLADMQDRAMMRSTLMTMEAFAVHTRTMRGMREKAARHYIYGTATAAIRGWQNKATVLRVARMRLRTAVARWLRTQLQQAFDEWKAQRRDARELFLSAERVADKTLGHFMQAFVGAWRGLIEAQDHKREVLTRILMRTQDRASFKAIHAWSSITSHIHRCRTLADRALARTRHAKRELAFAAWQDLRLRGLRAIRKMDVAVARWQRHLLFWCLDGMATTARFNALVRRRTDWLVCKCRLRMLGDVLHGWLQFAAYVRKVAKVGGYIAAKWMIGGARSHYAAWAAAAREQRRMRAAGSRVWKSVIRGAAGRALSQWGGATKEAKVRKVRVMRAMGKSVGSAQRDFFDLWRGHMLKSASVVKLAGRVEGRGERELLGGAWAAWADMWARETTMRVRGIDAFRAGKSRGRGGPAAAFHAWRVYAAQLARTAALSGRMGLKLSLRKAVASWRNEASLQRIQGERFERMRRDCGRRAARRFLDLWAAVHDSDVARANKLQRAMARWDLRLCGGAFAGWAQWWNKHVRAFEMHERAVERQGREALAWAAALWRHEALGTRLLHLKGGRLLASHLFGVARRAYGRWRALCDASRQLATRVEQAARRGDDRSVVCAWRGWLRQVEATNARWDAIGRMRERRHTALCRWTVGALHEVAREDRSWRARLGATIDKHEARMRGGALAVWAGAVQQTAGLVRLRERAVLSANVALAGSALAAWHGVAAWARRLAERGAIAAGRRARRTRQVALWEWAAEARALVRLREGVLRLVSRRDLLAEEEAAGAWRLWAARRARGARVAVARLERLQRALRVDALCEWRAAATREARQRRGVLALATRSSNAVAQDHVGAWRAAARHLARGSRAALRLIDVLSGKSLSAAVGAWAAAVRREVVVRKRIGMMFARAGRDVLGGAFVGWAQGMAAARARVEGFDRCVTKADTQSLRDAVGRWSETSAYEKRIRQVAELTRARSELSARGRAMRHMQHAVRCNAKLEVMVRRKNAEEAEYSLLGWRAYTLAVESKRSGLRRVMRRWEARTQREHLAGWKDAVEHLRAAWGRCQLVEQRAVADAAVRSVRALLRNAERTRRYKCLRDSFDVRWLRHRVRSHFEGWRYWHGKKMAVKGVLDQVVDMM